MLVLVEVNINNYQFFVTIFQNLNEYQFEINQGTIFGFKEADGQLISEHNDPHITLRNINDRIRYINIQCENDNPEALSQVFFRRVDEDWDVENSITFPLEHTETTVSLPRTLKVESLRLDLTNKAGDILTCQGFTLNPKTKFDVNGVRMGLFIFGLLGLLVSKKFIPEKFSNSVWQLLTVDGVWLFILLIVFINLAYPLTITYDAAHYLWLADLIRTGDWARWDPIRYLGFPLHIFLSLKIFGYHQNSLLYPMIVFHSLLFVFSCQIVFDVLNLKKGKERFLTALLIFLLIATDATVVGYFHALLTEFYAVTLAVISCSIAIKLYKSTLFSKQFYLLSSIYLILVPLAWHIKQPYIGAAFFPLLIITLMILMREFSSKILIYGLVLNFAVALLVIGSTLAWNTFLRSQGNRMRENRMLTTLLDEKLTEQAQNTQAGFGSFIEDKFNEYLAMSNYYTFNFRTRAVIKNTQIGRGNENTMIAHRLFTRLGESNLYFNSPKYKPYASFLQTTYSPPLWLNTLFQARLKLSHTLFTLTNLFLPIFTVIAVFLWIKNKSTFNASLLLLSTSSLLNMIAHLFLIIPNDRYQFWGYVFNLLILTIILVYLGNNLQKTVRRKRTNE